MKRDSISISKDILNLIPNYKNKFKGIDLICELRKADIDRRYKLIKKED